MRIAIFSDMHGNCVAFNAVLADVSGERFDHMVCLGDAIQGGPQPAEVVHRLSELDCPVVMGNADDWLLTGADSGAEKMGDERRRKMNDVRDWSLSQLSEHDLEFIRTFTPTVTLPLNEGTSLIGFHGSPGSFDELILPETSPEDLVRMLGEFEPDILAGGHTHVQQIHQLRRGFYLGVGSAGFAYRHGQDPAKFKVDSFAEYAVLTMNGDQTRVEFRRVAFDVGRLINVYRASGRPYAEEAIAQYQ